MPRKKQKGASGHFNRGKGGPKPGPPSTSQSKSNGPKQVSAKEAGPKKLPMQQNQRPIVPFLRKDRILLIGEGESSYFIVFELFHVRYS
jgi:25S rRNA (uracil2634-N3)-methyltransferase